MDFNNDSGLLSNVATISSNTGTVTFASTGAVTLPSGTTGQRPTAAPGEIRFNNEFGLLEFNNGSTWANVQSGVETISNLDSLSDVTISSPVATQLLSYTGSQWQNVDDPVWLEKQWTHSPTGFPNLTDSSISFNEGTRRFTIAPTGASFVIFAGGHIITKTLSEYIDLPNTSGMYFIYYTFAGVLSVRTTVYDFENNVPVAFVYWSSTQSNATIFAEERHGISMAWKTHYYLHEAFGMQYIEGLAASNYTTLGSGSANVDAQFGMASGTLADEDLFINVTATATPVNHWDQNLFPIAYLPLLYRTGATGIWIKDTATAYAVKQGASYLQFNEYTGSTWQTTEMTNGKYVATWIVGTNDVRHPIVAILGQRQDANLANAQANNQINQLSYGDYPFDESKFLYRLIFQTGNFSNTPHALLADFTDLRAYPAMQTVASVGTMPTSIALIGDATGSGATGGNTTVTLNTVNSNVGMFGSITQIPVITVNAKGLVTSVSNVSITDVDTITITGDATGSGTTGANTAITLSTVNSNVGMFGNATLIPQLTINAKGLVTSASNVAVTIPSGSISVTGSDFTMSGSTGSAITNGTLATVNSNVGQFGSATVVPQFTVNAKGLITAVSNVTITGTSAPIGSAYVTIGSDATLTGERALTITANQLTLTDGGANSTATLAIAANVVLPGIGAMTIPTGVTTARPANAVGLLRYNTTLGAMEYNTGAAWQTLGTSSATGTVTSVAALTLGTTGTDLSSTVANPTTTPVITLNVPTASAANRGALSAADWTTFNGKVSSVSVVSANGLAGTVAGTTAPAITLSTTITGMLKGNGTAISAAVAGTDYVVPTVGGGVGLRQISTAVAPTSGTASKADANTSPVITDGAQIWTQAITPRASSSSFTLDGSFYIDHDTNNRRIVIAIWRTVGAVNTLVGVSSAFITASDNGGEISISFYDQPATASAITYTMRAWANGAGTWYVGQGHIAVFNGNLGKQIVRLTETS